MDEASNIALFESLVPLIALVVIIALGVIALVQQFQRSLFKQRLEQEALKNNHQQDLLRTSITVQEKERQRIAGDLHDELGARLSMTLMQVKQAQESQATNSEEVLPQLQSQLEEALTATKRISYELMPPQLVNLGLYKALLVLIEEARQAGPLQIKLTKAGDPNLLPWSVQLGLYRMISELLNNTLKHAEASKVTIELRQEEGTIHCHYQDNGKGLSKTLSNPGLGLQSLEGRASSLNGELEWSPPNTSGFWAKIELPLATP